jgi:hypothetical protein
MPVSTEPPSFMVVTTDAMPEVRKCANLGVSYASKRGRPTGRGTRLSLPRNSFNCGGRAFRM